jgi:hypothetical protein
MNLHPLTREIEVLFGPATISKYLKTYGLKTTQDRLLKENYDPATERLIIFLVPGEDRVDGGIISYSSIYEETKKLKRIHGAETVMCTLPSDRPLLRYTKFPNKNYIFRFSQVLAYFQNLKSLMVHVEPMFDCHFLRYVTLADYRRLRRIKNMHFNLLIQNVNCLAPVDDVIELTVFGRLTCTTAHEKYATFELSQRYRCPLYKLSTFVSPEKYARKTYAEKEDLMIVSPDRHPAKAKVLSLIANRFPKLKIQIIRNLTYEEYLEVIPRAKWALTFGEGLDGYFIETIFSGGISLSAYNHEYFTRDFKDLRTVYGDYATLAQKICSDISDLDNEKAYSGYQDEQFKLCCKYYNHKQYVDNLASFYAKEYSCQQPEP